MKLILIAALFVAQCAGALAPHPRFLQPVRHGKSLLLHIRDKAAASHPSWAHAVETADYNYTTPPSDLGKRDDSAFTMAFVGAVIDGAGTRYGATYSADQYAVAAIAHTEAWLQYRFNQECGNTTQDMPRGTCWYDATNVDYWVNESGNIWYTTKYHYRNSGSTQSAYNVFLHNNLTNLVKASKAGLVNQWDWWQDWTNARIYVYSAMSPAIQGQTLTIAQGWLAFNQIRNEGMALPQLFDLLHKWLTTEQKLVWYQAMRAYTALFIYTRQGSWYWENTCNSNKWDYSPGNNGNNGGATRIAMAGLATHGDNPTDVGDTNEEMTLFKTQCWDDPDRGYKWFYSEDVGKGGWPIEGEEYGGSEGSVIQLMEWWYGATGVDLYQDIAPWCSDSLEAAMLLAPPSGLNGMLNRIVGIFEYAERDRTYYGSSGTLNKLLGCAWIVGSTTSARQLWGYYDSNYDRSYQVIPSRFVWYLYGGVPYGTALNTRPGAGGQVSNLGGVLTNGNGDNALVLMVMAGRSTEQTHFQGAMGSFSLRRGAIHLIDNPGYYSTPTTTTWIRSAEATSQITIKRTGVDGFFKGPRRGGHYMRGGCPDNCWPSISRSKFATNYGYLRANTGPGYDFPYDTSYGGWTWLNTANRDFVFDYAKEHIVIVDRLESASSFISRLQFPSPVAPANFTVAADVITIASTLHKATVSVPKAPAYTLTSGDLESIAISPTFAPNSSSGLGTTSPSGSVTTGLLPYLATNTYASTNTGAYFTATTPATSFCWVTAIQAGVSAFTPAAAVNLTAASGQFGIRVGSASPSITVGSCGLADVTSLTVQSGTFTGTARVRAIGLAVGNYNVTAGGGTACSNTAVGTDGTLECDITTNGEILISQGAPVITITTDCPITSGTEDSTYGGATFTAVNAQAAVAWGIVSGALPAGLSLGEATGAVTGTPTVAGAFNFTVEADDGIQTPATKACSVTINSIPVPLALAIASPINATVAVGSTTVLSATGGTAPYVFSIVSDTCAFTPTIENDNELTFYATATESCSITARVTDADTSTDDDVAQVLVKGGEAPTLELSLRPVVNGVVVTYGTAGLPSNVSCVVMVVDSSQQPVTETQDAGGLSRRRAYISVNDAGENLYLTAVCGQMSYLVLDKSFRPLTGEGPGQYIVKLGAPPAYLGATKAVLDYGSTEAMVNSTVPVACASGCSLSIPNLISGQAIYVRHRWLDASDNTLASAPAAVGVAR